MADTDALDALIQKVREHRNFLTRQSDCASGNFYYAVQDKKDRIGSCNDWISNNWKDNNGKTALSHSNKIYSELGTASYMFGRIVTKVDDVIEAAEAFSQAQKEEEED